MTCSIKFSFFLKNYLICEELVDEPEPLPVPLRVQVPQLKKVFRVLLRHDRRVGDGIRPGTVTQPIRGGYSIVAEVDKIFSPVLTADIKLNCLNF